MRKSIAAIITKLEKLREDAEEKMDSENEKTAERYEQVLECITRALQELEDVDALFEDAK